MNDDIRCKDCAFFIQNLMCGLSIEDTKGGGIVVWNGQHKICEHFIDKTNID